MVPLAFYGACSQNLFELRRRLALGGGSKNNLFFVDAQIDILNQGLAGFRSSVSGVPSFATNSVPTPATAAASWRPSQSLAEARCSR